MADRPDPPPKTVLLVEDDGWLRAILTELLAEEGFRVLQAASGTEALQLIEQEGPDVVVLDLQLPAKSGLEVLQELRAQDPTATLPVIVVSGEVDFETRARLVGRAARADGILEKPLDIGDFFEQVERAAET